MSKLILLLALCVSATLASTIQQVQNEKGCLCLGPWLGGLCLQWAGGSACTSGKRGVDSETLILRQKVEKEMAAKGCYCLGPWLGGLCLQWAGDSPCTSGKREVYIPKTEEDFQRCLCLTWNGNGLCILCSFGK